MERGHEDSVLASISELQRIEEDRVRDQVRRAEEAERARVARAEAERVEARRREEERAASIEAERAEARDRREAEARRASEDRLAREISLRSEWEREQSRRAQERAEAHAVRLAELEASAKPRVSGATFAALAAAALLALGAGGYWGVYQPMARDHAARVADLDARARQAERARDAAHAQADAIGQRLAEAASHPAVTAPVVTPVVPRTGGTNGTRTRITHVVPARTADPLINIDDDRAIFTSDDGARAPSARPQRRR